MGVQFQQLLSGSVGIVIFIHFWTIIFIDFLWWNNFKCIWYIVFIHSKLLKTLLGSIYLSFILIILISWVRLIWKKIWQVDFFLFCFYLEFGTGSCVLALKNQVQWKFIYDEYFH